jgi:hypothetical protein
MSSEKHTVTISGDEYIEYIRLKTEKKDYKSTILSNIDFYRNILKKEKESKTITVTLKKCNFPAARNNLEETFFEVHVSSLDSLSQTKFLAKKIMDLVFPLNDLNEKYKDKIRVLERNLDLCNEKIKIIPVDLDKKFKNLNWYTRLFYSAVK